MSEIIEVKDGNLILARLIPANLAWKSGLSFFSQDHEYIQAGTWVYEQGKQLKAHIHNTVIREVALTQEVIYVKQGKVKAKIYDTSENLVAELNVCAGDVIILLNGGHGYDIIDNNTQVLEIKNGPYLGPEIDRRRI